MLGASFGELVVVFVVADAVVVAIETFLKGATAAMSVTSINRAGNEINLKCPDLLKSNKNID